MSKRAKTPYWTKVLQVAARREKTGYMRPFTKAEIDKAGDWVTCACGKQDKCIPRAYDGTYEPADRLLNDLGMAFFDAVYTGDVKAAKRLLGQIEMRARYVVGRAKE